MKESIELAAARAAEYKLGGFHCSEAVVRACSEAVGLRLSDDVLRISCGFRGGGGGYMDRCGVIEAGCMLISHLYGRLIPAQSDWEYSYLICLLHDRFREHFGTVYCRDILPEERKKSDPVCIRVYREGAEIVAKLLLESQELLDGAPTDVRKKGRLWFS